MEYVHRIALSRPGYESYCGHQADILRRCQAWTRAAEHYYWPFGTTPTRESRTLTIAQACPVNRQRSEEAQSRIQRAIAELRQLQALPEAITARAKAIAQMASVSLRTLYKHLSLWHPDHQAAEEACKTPLETAVSGNLAPESETLGESLNLPEGQGFYTIEKEMKCVAPVGGGVGSELPPFSSERGVRGAQLGSPQAESPLPIPLAEVQGLIQQQVLSLGWTLEQMMGFVADHFGGRSRGQLLDAELPMLLYHLRAEALKSLGVGRPQGGGQ